MSNLRANREIAHLLEHLNAAEFTYPGTSNSRPAVFALKTRLF